MSQRLETKEQISNFFLLFIASLLVHPKASSTVQLALVDIIEKIAQIDPLKALSFLPILIYKLGKSSDPNVQLKV